MDEYNEAMDLELNESEVDEILGLEREREISEPVDEPEEEGFAEEDEGEEPEKEEPEPALTSVQKSGKKKAKRKVGAASSTVDEADGEKAAEKDTEQREEGRYVFHRIPLGEMPQIRGAVEMPLPKVDSYDAEGNLFIGGRKLASSEEEFSSYQSQGMERGLRHKDNWELESREKGSRIGVEAEGESHAKKDITGGGSNCFGVNALGNVPGCFGMAALVVEKALANPKSKLHISFSDGMTERSVKNGIPGIVGVGGVALESIGSTERTGKIKGNAGNTIQMDKRGDGSGEVAFGNGSETAFKNNSKTDLSAGRKSQTATQAKLQEVFLEESSIVDSAKYSFDSQPNSQQSQQQSKRQEQWKGKQEEQQNEHHEIQKETQHEINKEARQGFGQGSYRGSEQETGRNGESSFTNTQDSIIPEDSQSQIYENKRTEKQPGIRTLEGIGNLSEQGGRLVFRFVSGDVRDEGTAEQRGKEVLIRRAAFAVATMDTLAAGSARYTYLEHLKHFQRGGETAYKLVSEGKIGVPELLKPGRELRESLRDIGLKGSVVRDVMRNRREIYGTFQDVADVRKAVEAGRIGLRKEELEIFKSAKVFDRIRRGKQTNTVLQRLLKASDHEVLRKTRFTRKAVRTMIRRAEKYQLSKSEVRLLQKWLRNDRNAAYMRFTSRGFGAYAKILKNKADEQDDAATAGRKKIGQMTFSVKATAVAFLKTGRWTARSAGFAGGKVSYGLAEGVTWTARKVTGNQALDFHLIRQGKAKIRNKVSVIRKSAGEKAEQVRQGARKIRKKAAQKVRDSKPGRKVTAFRRQTKETIKKVNERFHHSRAGRFVKKAGSAAGKAGRIVKKPVKAVAKGAKATAKTVITPFKILGKMWAGLRRAIMVVGKYILIAVLVIAATYILLIFLNGAMEAAVAAVKAWVEDSEENIICVEDGITVQEWAGMLSVKDAELYRKAKELGEGTPKDPNVFHGKQIGNYGHPTNGGQAVGTGYMIHYIDAYGNPVTNSSTNIKDVIALCCVMFGQEMETDQDSREAFIELLEDMYDLMNPELTYKESEIYTCVGSGCGSYSYFCSSNDDYEEMDAMKREGVGFYGTVQTHSSGCYCPGHTSTWSHSGDDTSCPDIDDAGDSCGGHEETTYDDGCQCRGHSVSVCYGHKDVDIYIRVIAKEYVFAENLFPSGWESKGYAGYIREFVSERAWSNRELSEWAVNLCQQDWYSLYGVAVGNNYGFIVDGSEPHYEGGTFCFPLADYVRVSSDYGWRIHPISGERKFHSGIDFAAVSGTAIYAAADGMVTAAGFNSSMGNYVKIDHGNGLGTVYMHTSALYVAAGQTVEPGDVIAAVGSTGDSTGPHLHFSVTVNGTYVSPWSYLTGE